MLPALFLYGSRAGFVFEEQPMMDLNFNIKIADGMRVSASGDAHSPVLKRFFEGYDRAFVLPDEREELPGFEKCLALNHSHRQAFGRTHIELVMTIEDADGVLLGGANFLATSMAHHLNCPPATVALNYVYVEESARGRGLLRHALAAVRRLALKGLDLPPDAGEPALFIEQNDPLRLTPEEYSADTEHSGLDQVDRLAIWARVGAHVVDFAYIQPALSADQLSDDGLIYAAIDYPDDAVDAGLFHDHLESFFYISVLKGEGELPGGVATTQLLALTKREEALALLPMEPALNWMRDGRATDGFDSFRALATAAKQ